MKRRIVFVNPSGGYVTTIPHVSVERRIRDPESYLLHRGLSLGGSAVKQVNVALLCGRSP